MKQTFFDLDTITNNLDIDHKFSQEIAFFNGMPICAVSLQGETDWRISDSEKFIFVFHGTIALDFIEQALADQQEVTTTKLIGVRQGIVLSSQIKYRIRSAELSQILIIGTEDKLNI